MPDKYALQQAIDLLADSYNTHGSFMACQWFEWAQKTMCIHEETARTIEGYLSLMERHLRKHDIRNRRCINLYREIWD